MVARYFRVSHNRVWTYECGNA